MYYFNNAVSYRYNNTRMYNVIVVATKSSAIPKTLQLIIAICQLSPLLNGWMVYFYGKNTM